MEQERVAQLPSNKYKDIVKKAKETRTSREKSLNSSQDASFDAFRKRRRKKANLSQSFVMRQTIALSTKNKQLVNSLTQSKLFAAELEKNLRIIQEKFMTLIMKLNSTEVAFGKCKYELDVVKEVLGEKEESYRNLRFQLQSLLDSTAEQDEGSVAKKYSPTVKHSNLPQRVALPRNRYSSVTPKPKNKKWKPELDIVEETGHNESVSQTTPEHDLPATSPFSLPSNETSFTSSVTSPKEWTEPQPRRSSLNSTILDHDAKLSAERRSKRRATVIHSYFDPEDSLLDVEHEEDTSAPGSPQLVLLLDDDGEDLFDAEEEIPLEDKESPCNGAAATAQDFFASENDEEHDKGQGKSNPNFSPTIRDVKCSKKQRKVSREKRIPSFTEHQNADSTNHSIVSMDLTTSNDCEIVVTKKPTKQKQLRKKKTTESKKKSKKKDEALVKSDMDVFNCSNDSFLINPGKKIQLSSKSTEDNSKDKELKDNSREKTRSLPMINITNVMAEESEPSGRRRRTCVSYAEPSLRKKIRRGDKFFQPS